MFKFFGGGIEQLSSVQPPTPELTITTQTDLEAVIAPLEDPNLQRELVRYYRVHDGDFVPETHEAGPIIAAAYPVAFVVESVRENNESAWRRSRIFSRHWEEIRPPQD